MNPINLLNHNRFDVIAKYIYALFRENNINSNFGIDLYKEHLLIWNNFNEKLNKNKSGFDIFVSVFNNILDNIKLNGFDSNISKVIADNKNNLLNGGHRLAACLLFNREITTEIKEEKGFGQKDCGFEYFKRLGLNAIYSDYMAFIYSKLIKSLQIVTLFPSTNFDECIKIIKEFGDIYYYKKISFNKHGQLFFIKNLYHGEKWGGDDDKGFKNKTIKCFGNKNNVYCVLVDFKDLDRSVQCKAKIRKIYNVGNHSVHINDTNDETIRISKLVFNDNSINYSNKHIPQSFINYKNLCNQYANANKNYDDYCITSSAVMSVYGLRDCKDLDYLCKNKELNISKLISSHNKEKYPINIDEIIYNPKHHFYVYDVKYASLDVVKLFKQNRSEKKDLVDLKLIESIK